METLKIQDATDAEIKQLRNAKAKRDLELERLENEQAEKDRQLEQLQNEIIEHAEKDRQLRNEMMKSTAYKDDEIAAMHQRQIRASQPHKPDAHHKDKGKAPEIDPTVDNRCATTSRAKVAQTADMVAPPAAKSNHVDKDLRAYVLKNAALRPTKMNGRRLHKTILQGYKVNVSHDCDQLLSVSDHVT